MVAKHDERRESENPTGQIELGEGARIAFGRDGRRSWNYPSISRRLISGVPRL